MIIFQASHLEKAFADKTILSNATLTIQDKDKIGLVGANGAGKSTLLKIMVGKLPQDKGEIIKANNLTYAYLAQDSQLDSKKSIWEEMLSVFQELIELEKEIHLLEKDMQNEENFSRYEILSEKFRLLGGYEYKTNIAKVLNGLNFNKKKYDIPIFTLSGGQKTRLALAKQLLINPQLLILDEPTNYLDMETVIWLEQYLKNYNKAILVVSHDRYFLDQITNITYELENTKLQQYKGNYSRFLALKEEKLRLQEKLYLKQKEEIKKQSEFIQKNIARASTTARAKSREKMLAKITPLEKPTDFKKAHFSFLAQHESGNDVLTLRNLKIGYPNNTLSQNISGIIHKGHRVALVGANGTGKTTFLKTICNQLFPLDGKISLGSQVFMGYYEQEQSSFISEKQMLHEVWDEFKGSTEQEIRSLLAGFLLKGDNVFKPMGTLSGGEKARVSLAKLSLLKANFLLLDEPTNHLDIYAREILEKALLEYSGTILFISHDRYFLKKIATQIWELTPLGIEVFEGNYEYYCSKKQQINSFISENKIIKNKTNYQLQKEEKRKLEKKAKQIKNLEDSIQKAEEKISLLQNEMNNPNIYQDIQLLQEKNQELENLQNDLATYYQGWLELTEEQ